jgi:phospholipase/lecithinase/hemolysin
MISIGALGLLAAAMLVNAQDPNYFISFGDSYSQTGFVIDGAKPSPSNPLGNPPLPGWTASGGLDWVGFMVTEFNASLTYSYNFAYGGATVDADIVTPYDPSVISFIDQVQIFSDNLAAKPDYAPWTSENTVVGVWMGVNDIGNSFWLGNSTDVNTAVIGRYFEQLEILHEAGIRSFILLSVPPTDRSPLMLQNAVPLSAAIEDFNGKLATQLEEFKAAHNGTRAVLVDTHVPFLEALDNPQEYGSPDDTCFNGDGVSCLWFNDYHPGVEIQRLVGAEVANAWGSGFFECVDSVLCTARRSKA